MAFVLCGGAWIAYTQQQAPQLKINKLRDNLWEIEEDGGNVTVYVTNEGTILVDDKFDRDHDQIMSLVKSVTNQPIKYIINTHHHGDHTGGNGPFAKDGTTGSVSQRGGAPGTRETNLLDPVNNVQIVNAIVLSGGSAFGLDAASGTMKWLDEHNIGYPVGAAGVVPIVPSAILFDLGFGGNPKVRPGADCGYKAAEAASEKAVQMGNFGAGAGSVPVRFSSFFHSRSL